MFNTNDLQKELDKFKNKLSKMSQEEKSALVSEIAARVEEARHTLLDAHDQGKPPIECITETCKVLDQIGQPRTIN